MKKKINTDVLLDLSTTFHYFKELKRIYPMRTSDFHEFYTGVDTETEKKLFIKVDTKNCGSTEREASILNLPHIKKSPYFPKMVHEGKRDLISFIAMEYIEGMMLNRYLYRTVRRAQLQNEEFFSQLLQIGLILLDEGIVHRDMRPGNIFVTSDIHGKFKRLILIDFAFSVGMNRFSELPILKEQNLLKGLGSRKYKVSDYEWDNFYAIEKIAERIDKSFHNHYPHLSKKIASYKGKQVYKYK